MVMKKFPIDKDSLIEMYEGVLIHGTIDEDEFFDLVEENFSEADAEQLYDLYRDAEEALIELRAAQKGNGDEAQASWWYKVCDTNFREFVDELYE